MKDENSSKFEDKGRDENNGKFEDKGKGKDKKKLIFILVIAVLIVILLAVAVKYATLAYQFDRALRLANKVSQLQDDFSYDTEMLEDDSKIRIKINPAIIICEDMILNLDFYNYNENRLMQCKIKLDDRYIYVGELLKPGEYVQCDYLKKPALADGYYEALAEIYYYDLNRVLLGQTNVVMSILADDEFYSD